MNKWLILIFLAGITVLVVSACATSRSNYGTASYKVARKDGSFEIRDYAELKLASTGKGEDNNSFRQLFRYIDGGNATKEKISMTTPVFMDKDGMSFVLPEKNKNNAPQPAAEAVVLKTMPARTMAVYGYTGFASKKSEKIALGELKTWLAANKLDFVDEPAVAYYDPPWTLPFLRRNEVMVPLKSQE
jgi:hypothetical protein